MTITQPFLIPADEQRRDPWRVLQSPPGPLLIPNPHAAHPPQPCRFPKLRSRDDLLHILRT